MDKRYYVSSEVMDLLRIKRNNYRTLRAVCVELKLPRIKIGKALLFPARQFEQRLAIIERQRMANYGIQEAS